MDRSVLQRRAVLSLDPLPSGTRTQTRAQRVPPSPAPLHIHTRPLPPACACSPSLFLTVAVAVDGVVISLNESFVLHARLTYAPLLCVSMATLQSVKLFRIIQNYSEISNASEPCMTLSPCPYDPITLHDLPYPLLPLRPRTTHTRGNIWSFFLSFSRLRINVWRRVRIRCSGTHGLRPDRD